MERGKEWRTTTTTFTIYKIIFSWYLIALWYVPSAYWIEIRKININHRFSCRRRAVGKRNRFWFRHKKENGGWGVSKNFFFPANTVGRERKKRRKIILMRRKVIWWARQTQQETAWESFRLLYYFINCRASRCLSCQKSFPFKRFSHEKLFHRRKEKVSR